jgi:uncharacterized protein (DUF433 family)
VAEMDLDLVDTISERLRPFKLRLGENTAGFIADGRRVIELSGGERRDLAAELAVLVDELVALQLAAAGPGHHASITADPERNGGRASFTAGMVPLYAAIGLLNAGYSPEHVREEFGLTEDQVVVAAALVDDFRDLAAGGVHDDEEPPPPDEDACRAVEATVDGRPEVVRVRGAEPMTDLDRAMFAELVAATRAYAAEDEHMAVRQELAMAWMTAAARIPEGPEKTRLRAAVKAAQEALQTRRNNGDGDANVDIPGA